MDVCLGDVFLVFSIVHHYPQGNAKEARQGRGLVRAQCKGKRFSFCIDALLTLGEDRYVGQIFCNRYIPVTKVFLSSRLWREGGTLFSFPLRSFSLPNHLMSLTLLSARQRGRCGRFHLFCMHLLSKEALNGAVLTASSVALCYY